VMKIYWWSRVETLAQHAAGMVVVFASSKEEAVSLAIATYGPDEEQGGLHWRPPYQSRAALEKELRDKEPEVFDGPRAFIIEGSS